MAEGGCHPCGGPDGALRRHIYLLQRDNAGDRQKVVYLKSPARSEQQEREKLTPGGLLYAQGISRSQAQVSGGGVGFQLGHAASAWYCYHLGI